MWLTLTSNLLCWRGLILKNLEPYLNLLLRMRLSVCNTPGWNRNGAITRAVLFDFRKAFDLIDHHVLAQKLSSYDLPESIMCWILDFLTNRRQRVKLSCGCVSEWRAVPAGVPQGIKLGPWLFLIMINDLSVANTNIWKYVDDTTLLH